MLSKVLTWVVLVTLPLIAAGEETDYQLRTLLHLQKTQKEATFGLASWAVIPDVTAKPFRGLLVAGVVAKDNAKWVEAMGGVFISSSGKVERVVNLRAQNKRKHLSIYAETMINFSTKRNVFVGALTAPGNFLPNMKLGIESELLLGKGKMSLGIGPRIVMAIPFARKKGVLTTTFHFRNKGQPSILRQYVLLNF